MMQVTVLPRCVNDALVPKKMSITYLACPCNLLLINHPGVSTNYFLSRAIKQGKDCPAFWLRGIMPSTWVPKVEPTAKGWVMIGTLDLFLPVLRLRLYTDGSGGPNTDMALSADAAGHASC